MRDIILCAYALLGTPFAVILRTWYALPGTALASPRASPLRPASLGHRPPAYPVARYRACRSGAVADRSAPTSNVRRPSSASSGAPPLRQEERGGEGEQQGGEN
eukprot:1830806-Rhodomonas_salina.1